MPERRYLLDTNILSDLIRNPEGLVFHRIAEVSESSVCTSIIVACELRYGAFKKNAPISPAKSSSCWVCWKSCHCAPKPTTTTPASAPIWKETAHRLAQTIC